MRRDVVERLDITQNRMAHASEIVAQIGERFDGKVALRARARCTSSTPTTRKAKGQSLWNAVNILAELIWR